MEGKIFGIPLALIILSLLIAALVDVPVMTMIAKRTVTTPIEPQICDNLIPAVTDRPAPTLEPTFTPYPTPVIEVTTTPTKKIKKDKTTEVTDVPPSISLGL